VLALLSFAFNRPAVARRDYGPRYCANPDLCGIGHQPGVHAMTNLLEQAINSNDGDPDRGNTN
jgi:hypothetical protein